MVVCAFIRLLAGNTQVSFLFDPIFFFFAAALCFSFHICIAGVGMVMEGLMCVPPLCVF